MPVINLDYNDEVVSEAEAQALANALQKIVAEATNIADVNVYANTAYIKVNVLPVEIFIRMSAKFVEDPAILSENIRSRIASWKSEHSFPHLINIYVIPMNWTVTSGI
jgi:hypothetical protein